MHRESLSVPATLDALGPIATFVLAAAARAGLSERATYRLRLAVDELASNAALYGFPAPLSGQTPTFDLHADLDEQALTVILEDNGIAFDPRQAPQPDLAVPANERPVGGLGVYLARTGVDRYSYERVDQRNRNILVVERHRHT